MEYPSSNNSPHIHSWFTLLLTWYFCDLVFLICKIIIIVISTLLSAHGQWLQSCLTLFDPMGCSPPGSSVCGTFQARILEWVAISSSRGSSWPRDWICVTYISCILCHWAIGEAYLHYRPTNFKFKNVYICFKAYINKVYKVFTMVQRTLNKSLVNIWYKHHFSNWDSASRHL